MADTEKLQATLSSTAQLEGRVQNQTTLVGTAAVPYSVGGGSGGSGGTGGFLITAPLDFEQQPVTPDKTYEEAVAAFELGQAINLRIIADLGDVECVLTPFMVGFTNDDSGMLLPQGFTFMCVMGGNALMFSFMPDGMIYVSSGLGEEVAE